MALEIRKVGDQYVAEVTPPHGKGCYWKAEKPMGLDALISKLQSLGCHPTDIGDVLDEMERSGG
jgi:hypothetical protein